jgi:hypothetical protein
MENGYEYVDLGLSVKWATCNVGADKPEDYGDYYAWGETEPKSEYTWENYKFRKSGNEDWNVKFNKYGVKVDGKTYKVTQVNANAFTGSKIKSAVVNKNVKKIKKNAFKNSKAVQLIVKTKKLTKKSVKGSLKGSKIKKVVVKVGSKKANKKYVKKYKKYFTKKNAGKKVKVVKAN